MQITSAGPLVATLVLLLEGAAPAHGAEIERSPADTRHYRALMLDNGLEVLVVSDPEADKSAAALNVNVGSGDDPEDRPGARALSRAHAVSRHRKISGPR